MSSTQNVNWGRARASAVSRGVLVTTLATASQIAGAQSGPEPSGSQQPALEEVVVTAQFRKQSVQDTPLSVTAIDAKMLEARGQSEVTQIAEQAPNVTLVQGGGIFGPSIGAQIRGIGQFDSSPAYEPGVGMYVDDVYISTLSGAMLDLLDLERIEVLRGPQGTLTGRNSIGGAVKLFSRKPDGSDDGNVELGIGSRDKLSARASLGFKISDSLSGRAAAVHKEQDGYIDQVDYGCANPGNAQGIAATRDPGRCTIAKLGGQNYSGARLAVRYQEGSVDWLVSGDYSKIDNTARAELLTYTDGRVPADFNCGRDCNYFNYAANAGLPLLGTATPQLSAAITVPNREWFKGWGVSSNASIDFNDTLNLQAITAYRHYDTQFSSDDDGTPGAITGFGFSIFTHRFFSQEVRLNGAIGSSIDWTIGGFYSDQRTLTYHLGDAGYIVPGMTLQFYTDDPINADSKAAFATAIIRPFADTTITAGVRYTEESKDYTFVRLNLDDSINTFLDPAGDINGLTSRFNGDRVDYRLSLDYRLSSDVLAYTTVSTGFKGGGVTSRPFNAAQARLGVFGPETLTAYEVGLKADLLDRTLRVNLAAFVNDYKKVQQQIADCTAYGGGPICAVVANSGDARFKGVELELTLRPVDNLDIDASLSYLDAEWKKLAATVIGDPVTRPNGVFLDDPASSAPKWKASAGIQYAFNLASSGSITPRVDFSYTDERFQGRNTAIAYSIPGYSLVNANLTWRNSKEDVSVTLEAMNLFDKYYYDARFDGLYGPTGMTFSSVGKPREFGLRVKHDF